MTQPSKIKGKLASSAVRTMALARQRQAPFWKLDSRLPFKISGKQWENVRPSSGGDYLVYTISSSEIRTAFDASEWAL
jgi:hypothetical protein